MNESYLIKFYKHCEKTYDWDNIFFKICKDSEQNEIKRTYNVSNEDENFEKNRYRNVLPYDDNRIILKMFKNQNGYINASPLQLPFNERRYILTQGPLSNTLDDFWQMVYDENSWLIVMLSKIFEHGQMKCHPYFPTLQKKTINSRLFSCQLLGEINKGNYAVRKIQLIPQNKYFESQSIEQPKSVKKIVYHYQYLKWPDFDVPEKTGDFLQFLFEVRKAWNKLEDKDSELRTSNPVEQKTSAKNSPIICHCSAGIGRTGTFVIVDTVLSILEKQKMCDTSAPSTTDLLPLSFEDLVVSLRRYRMGLIQTPQQLRFSLMAIVDWIQDSNNSGSRIASCPRMNNLVSASISDPSDMNSECVYENQISKLSSLKRLNPKQEKRKEMVEDMRRKMREWENRKNLPIFRRLLLDANLLWTHHPLNIIVSTTCIALLSFGIYYFLASKK